jgi:hypothetical protein
MTFYQSFLVVVGKHRTAEPKTGFAVSRPDECRALGETPFQAVSEFMEGRNCCVWLPPGKSRVASSATT